MPDAAVAALSSCVDRSSQSVAAGLVLAWCVSLPSKLPPSRGPDAGRRSPRVSACTIAAAGTRPCTAEVAAGGGINDSADGL